MHERERLAQAVDGHHLDSELAARRVRARHDGALETVLLCLGQPFLAERHRAYLARQPELAEHDEILRHGALAQARDDGEGDGEICGRLADAQTADDVREHVAVSRREPAVSVQNREQQTQALRVESLREPARRLTLRAIDERLHLDEHRSRALSRHERHAARDGSAMPRQENRGRVLDFAEALLAHHEEAHLVRCPEAVLDGAHDAEAAAEIAFEVQDGVDHVLEHARPCERTLLGDVPDQQGRNVARLREARELCGAFANLAHGARRRL